MNGLDFNVATPNLSYPVFKASQIYKHVYLKPSEQKTVKKGRTIIGKLFKRAIEKYYNIKHFFRTKNNPAERFHELSEKSIRNINNYFYENNIN